MNLLDGLRRQFDYDAWANGEVLAALRAAGAPSHRSLQLMAHIFAAEQLWLERIRQQPQTSPVWPKADLGQCQTEAEQLARRWREYLHEIADHDLSRLVSYKNSKGETWRNTIADILTHVLMHSAYHRGQVASHMRENGQAPAHTDFIHGIRQGMVK